MRKTLETEGVGTGTQGSLDWALALVSEVPQGHRDQSVWPLCWNPSLCPGNGSSSDHLQPHPHPIPRPGLLALPYFQHLWLPMQLQS